MIFARKIYKIPEFHMIFARKNARVLRNNCPKNIFVLGGRGARVPHAPSLLRLCSGLNVKLIRHSYRLTLSGALDTPFALCEINL